VALGPATLVRLVGSLGHRCSRSFDLGKPSEDGPRPSDSRAARSDQYSGAAAGSVGEKSDTTAASRPARLSAPGTPVLWSALPLAGGARRASIFPTPNSTPVERLCGNRCRLRTIRRLTPHANSGRK
jgi:hypothetical protein